MNKFEHVSSDGHQMSLPGVGVGGPMSDVRVGGVPYLVYRAAGVDHG